MKFATHKIRRAIALALIVWCAGTGCVIVSYAHSAMSSSDMGGAQSPAHSMSDTTAMMSGHACCKARHSSKRSEAKSSHEFFTGGLQQVALPEGPNPSGANSCCPLTSGSFVAASRAQTNDDGASAAQTNSNIPILSNAQTALAIPLRLSNQSQTYLRVCVFLI